MTQPAQQAIQSLIARYAELVDDGDFTGVGRLLARATFTGGGAALHGAEEIEARFGETTIRYEDGTPRTHHVTTNTVVEVDEAAGTAQARSYVTVFQSLPELPLQAVIAGRYRDRFAVDEAGEWHFTERRFRARLVGDLSHHLR